MVSPDTTLSSNLALIFQPFGMVQIHKAEVEITPNNFPARWG